MSEIPKINSGDEFRALVMNRDARIKELESRNKLLEEVLEAAEKFHSAWAKGDDLVTPRYELGLKIRAARGVE